MEFADMHIHSNSSDGLLSPEEIVDWGKRKALKAVSITDHDSISGIEQAVNYAEGKDIEVIPGIELSTEVNLVEVHMLGYFFNYKDQGLKEFLIKLTKGRTERAVKMVNKLNRIGIMIKYDDVLKSAGDTEAVGRPHVARALIRLGYCSSMEEAFEKYLGNGKPGYVQRYKLSPFEAVEIIKKYGGVSSIAHPGLIKNINTRGLISKLKTWGLSGIEVYHTKHTEEVTAYYKKMACELDLIPTGGSDCHGTMEDGEPLLGTSGTPYENVLKLKNRLSHA